MTPGSVSPLALINDSAGIVTAVFDADLFDAAAVNVHPLVNTRTTSLAPADLLAFCRSTGHEPAVIAIPAD